MYSYVPLGLFGLSLFWLLKRIAALNRNIALAKATGLPYHISPVNGTPGYLYFVFEPLVVGILKALPYLKDSKWPVLCTVNRTVVWQQEIRERCGENFLIVSPWSTYLNCSDPEGVLGITTRRLDFVKPLEFYAIIDIFGSSIISTEGDTWKRHRKIVAPAFAERSNLLVWEESIRQAKGLLNAWSKMEGNTKNSMLVNDAGINAAHLALHVISGAGFGVSQVWPGDNEDQLGKSVIPGFNTTKLEKGHTYTFKGALQELISNVVWMMLIPESLLKLSPFDLHKRLLRAHFECTNYFKELADYKSDLLEKGNLVDARTMDIMAPLVKASQITPSESGGQYLTKPEVTANSWLLLFAGHETSANTLHYTITFLAISLATQSLLQHELDTILASRPAEEWRYEKDMGRLYNSLVGASFSEALRLRPPVPAFPKACRRGPQILRIKGKEHLLPSEMYIHVDAGAVHRHPDFWPHEPSLRTGKAHDLDDFKPQRWLNNKTHAAKEKEDAASSHADVENIDGLERVSFESKSGGLLVPVRGSYIPFAEGPRSCPGRRFAQVELTAVLTTIFKNYTVELDVSKWASDAEVSRMNKAERKVLYDKAMVAAQKVIDDSVMLIALKMVTTCPLRIVKRGEERFMDCYL